MEKRYTLMQAIQLTRRRKTIIEKIKNSTCVEEFYQNNDGYWADLKDGYTHYGATTVREDSLCKLWSALAMVEIDTDLTSA